jgi:Carbohydrate binding domain
VVTALGFSTVTVIAVAAAVAVNVGDIRTGGSDRPPRAAATPAAANGGGFAPVVPTPIAPSPQQSPTTKQGTELVREGDFTDSPVDWYVTDKADIKVSRQRLQVDVSEDSGDDPAAVLVMHDLRTVEPGRNYVLKFQGSADTDATIVVTIQRDIIPGAATLLTKEAKLTSKMRDFTFEFSAREDLNPLRICFQVGGHRQGNSMWLDNVSITEAG